MEEKAFCQSSIRMDRTGTRWLKNVKTLPGARTMALDHKTGIVYLPVADVGPAPAATPTNPRPRRSMAPGSFSVLVVGM